MIRYQVLAETDEPVHVVFQELPLTLAVATTVVPDAIFAFDVAAVVALVRRFTASQRAASVVKVAGVGEVVEVGELVVATALSRLVATYRYETP